MRRDDLLNLDIRISSGGSGPYNVELKIGDREFPTGTMGQEVLSAGEVGPADEGVRLFRALVADVGLRSAWDQAGALHPRRRIRLRIDDGAPELNALAWETLHDPSPAAAVRTLAADLDTPFSRYIACPWEPLGPALAPIRVLTAVAAPAGLENYDLAPIDREFEVATVTDALQRAPAGLVQHTVLAGPCTLAALAAELERGYHVLHLVAHGAVSADRTGSVMFLEEADGGIERVDAARFARAIDCLHRSLRLVVLMSCNTATRSPTDPRFGFAPALLGAGVPAVLAMQDRMPMSTGAAFTRAFYEELWTSGEIDRAANRARRVVITERLPGTAVPALYATRMSLRLWGPESVMGQVPEARSERTPEPAPPPVAAPAPGPARESPAAAPPQTAADPPTSQVESPRVPAAAAAEATPAPRTPAHGATATRGEPERAPREPARGATRGEPERAPREPARGATRDEPARASDKPTRKGTATRGEPARAPREPALSAQRDEPERSSREPAPARGRGAPTRRAEEEPAEDAPELPDLEWEKFGESISDLQIIHGLGGCLEAFARDDDGALIRRYQSEPDGEWGPWDVFAENVEAYTVVSDGRGRIAVFTLAGDGWLRLCAVTDCGWSEWIDVHEAPSAQIAAAYRKRGLVLMVATEDALHILEQQRKGGWDEPYEISGGFDVFVLASNGADHLHLFGIDSDGRLATTVQREARGTWDDWSDLGVGFRGMHTFLSEDGRLHLVAVGAEEGVSQTIETEPGAGWEEWETTPLTYVDVFALSRAGRGIEAYAIDGDGNGWRETSSDAGQGTRGPLGLHGLVALRAIETESGNVELFAVDEYDGGTAWRCVLP